jgi:hypothetical protein
MYRYTRARGVVVAALALTAMFGLVGDAYTTYGKWATDRVTFYVNPQNLDVDPAAAEAALQSGMNVWHTQSGSSFRFVYGGRVNDTTTGNDNRNVIIFRNATNNSAIASTYSWSYAGALVDSDIIFWDAAYTFFTGASGCAGGAYIEDIAAHELGHAMGLQHSTVADATMYPSYSYCSQEQRTLSADDMEGAQYLYPGSSSTANTAPAVSVITPGDNSSVASGSTISFSGSATDKEDGNLSAQLKWTSSLDGPIGTGSAFSRSLSSGTHTIMAEVIDSGSLRSSSQIALMVTVPAPPPTGLPLTVRAYRLKGGIKRVDLTWSGLTASSVDLYRNGVKVKVVPNQGSYVDNLSSGGSYTYKVCETGSTMCAGPATAQF